MKTAEHYTDADLAIGNTISVFGREFLMYSYNLLIFLMTSFISMRYDADAYTRSFYEETYGVTEFPHIQVSEQARAIVTRVFIITIFNYYYFDYACWHIFFSLFFQIKEIPEYTGIGSEEDSLANCLSLVPKAPKKAPKNANYTPSDVMRFTAQMEGGKRGDEERRFVVSYFLEDDTFSVFENPIRYFIPPFLSLSFSFFLLSSLILV